MITFGHFGGSVAIAESWHIVDSQESIALVRSGSLKGSQG